MRLGRLREVAIQAAVGTLIRFKRLLEAGQVQGNPSAYLMRMLRNRTQGGWGDSKHPRGDHRRLGLYPSAGAVSPTSAHRPRRPFYRCVSLPSIFAQHFCSPIALCGGGTGWLRVPWRHAPSARQQPVRRGRRAGPALLCV